VNLVTLVERFGSHQWCLLKLLQEEKAAVDLAHSNLIMAYCLANNAEFRGTRQDAAGFQAICYSHRKQRVIAKWLGFPDSEAIVRLFGKIQPEAVYPSILRLLRGALTEDSQVLQLLSHHAQINTGMLELVTDHRSIAVITPKLLSEVENTPDEFSDALTAGMLRDSLNIVQQIAPGRRIVPFLRIARIREFAETTDAEYIEHEKRKEANRLAAIETRERLPPPPIPGTSEIVPIMNLRELRVESKAQHNCVGSYALQIRKGKTYIYKVLYPERATLCIIKGADGCWYRDEIRRTHNREVRQSTKHIVDNWLAKYRLSV
jgi:hypothetical protein